MRAPLEKVLRLINLADVEHKARYTFLIAIIIITFCAPFNSSAQYYPSPKVTSSASLAELHKNLKKSRPGTHQINLLNSLASLYLSFPPKRQSDIESAIYYSKLALNQSVVADDRMGKSDAILLLSECYSYIRDLKQAEQLLVLSDNKTKVRLLIQLSFFFWNSASERDLNKSIDYAKQAIILNSNTGQESLTLMAKRMIGLAHVSQGSAGAEKELLELVPIHKSKGINALQYIYFSLAYLARMQEKQPDAYKYIQSAVDAVSTTKDSIAGGDVYFLKGIILTGQEQFQEAKNAMETALKYYERHSGMYSISSVDPHNQLSIVYDKMGQPKKALAYTISVMKKYPATNYLDSLDYLERLGQAYRELKDYRNAEQTFSKKLSLRKAHKDENINDEYSFAQLYVESGQYHKARPLINLLLESEGYKKFRTSRKRHLHYIAFLTDSATGRYQSAIRHQSFLINEANVNSRLEKDKLVKELEVKYRTRDQERELTLKNQNIKLLRKGIIGEQQKVRQSRQILMLGIGAIILLGIILILVIILLKNNKANSKRISIKNQILEKLLDEKEWLFKEIHHRVKNNMHIIFSLLESQARMADRIGRQALEKSKIRVYAMSLFHQKVYQSEDMEQVDFAMYVEELLRFISETFDLSDRKIKISLDMDHFLFPVKTAMVIALIANEVLTNAVKYAFKNMRSGELRLSLKRNKHSYSFIISDNGIGLSQENLTQGKSLGMNLIHGLCGDIGATVDFDTTAGTKVTIQFQIENETENQEVNFSERQNFKP